MPPAAARLTQEIVDKPAWKKAGVAFETRIKIAMNDQNLPSKEISEARDEKCHEVQKGCVAATLLGSDDQVLSIGRTKPGYPTPRLWYFWPDDQSALRDLRSSPQTIRLDNGSDHRIEVATKCPKGNSLHFHLFLMTKAV